MAKFAIIIMIDKVGKNLKCAAVVHPLKHFSCLLFPQCQAIVVGFLASIGAFVLGWIQDGRFELNHALILCTSSIITASIASFTLGTCAPVVMKNTNEKNPHRQFDESN